MGGKRLQVLLLVIVAVSCIVPLTQCDDDDDETPSKPFVNSTDPVCLTAKCKDKPKLGACVPTDPSNSSLTEKAGKFRMCCPVWECTQANGSITEHWGYHCLSAKQSNTTRKTSETSSTITETATYSNYSRSTFIWNMQMSVIQTTTCSAVKCSMKPAEGTCEAKDSQSTALAAKAGRYGPCCSLWHCKMASGNIFMSFGMSVSYTYASSSETKISSSQTTEVATKDEVISCSQFECGSMPVKYGTCVAKNVSESKQDTSKMFGPMSYCCPMWECTSDTLGVTDHYAIIRIAKNGSSPDGSGGSGKPMGRSLMGINSCKNVECMKPDMGKEVTCEAMPMDNKTITVGKKSSCCPTYQCKDASGSLMSYHSHSGMKIRVISVSEVFIMYDESITIITEEIEGEGMTSKTCPKSTCPPPPKKTDCTELSPKQVMRIQKKLGMNPDGKTCCPVIRCKNDEETYITYYVMRMKDGKLSGKNPTVPVVTIIEPKDEPQDSGESTGGGAAPKGRGFNVKSKEKCPPNIKCNQPNEKDISSGNCKPLEKVTEQVMTMLNINDTCCPVYKCGKDNDTYLTNYGSSIDNNVATTTTTMKPVAIPETTMKPVPTPETTMMPVAMPETTMKPVPMPETTMKPVPMPETTMKPAPIPETTMKPAPMPETTMKPAPMPETTMKPAPMPETTMKPAPMPETTMKPAPMPETTMKPASMPETTTMPVGRMLETKKPKGPSIKKGVGVMNTTNIIMTPSTNPSRQCKNILCFPASNEASCKPTNITDCSILKVLGNLARCCPAYACRNDSMGIVETQMGFTDGLSETGLSYEQTDEEFKKNPEKCDEIAVLAETYETDEPTTPKTNMATQPMQPGDGRNSPTTKPARSLPKLEYVATCVGITCMPPQNVDVAKCEKFTDWLTVKMKELGISETCCPLWKCPQPDGSVTTEFAIDAKTVGSPEGVAVPLEYKPKVNATDNKKPLPNTVAEHPTSYSTCPGVKCIPPMMKETCKPSKTPNCVKSGPLRNKKQCCPLWECNLKNGVFTVYGRTAAEEDFIFGTSSVQIQSIFMSASTSQGEEENSEVDFEDGKGMKGRSKSQKKKWSASSASVAATQMQANTMIVGGSKKTDNAALVQFGAPMNCPGNCPPSDSGNKDATSNSTKNPEVR